MKKEKSNIRGVLVLVVIVCVWLYCCGGFESDGTAVNIGDRVTFVENTYGTIDKDDKDLGSSLAAGDIIGIMNQINSGRAKRVWKGEHGLIVRYSWSRFQVRFDDGSLYWVPAEFVTKE